MRARSRGGRCHPGDHRTPAATTGSDPSTEPSRNVVLLAPTLDAVAATAHRLALGLRWVVEATNTWWSTMASSATVPTAEPATATPPSASPPPRAHHRPTHRLGPPLDPTPLSAYALTSSSPP